MTPGRLRRAATAMSSALARGVFPHQFSFLLDLRIRRLVLSPRTLVTRLQLTPQDRVLEIGCGSGAYSSAIASQCRELVLLDLQTEMLGKARNRLDGVGNGRSRLVCADAANLPFGPASFDVICVVAVFGEVSRRTDFVVEAHRVLSGGGRLSISEHLPDPDSRDCRRSRISSPATDLRSVSNPVRFGPTRLLFRNSPVEAEDRRARLREGVRCR